MNTILHPLSLVDTKCVCASFNPVLAQTAFDQHQISPCDINTLWKRVFWKSKEMVTQDGYRTVWFSKTYNTSMRISLYIQGVHKAFTWRSEIPCLLSRILWLTVNSLWLFFTQIWNLWKYSPATLHLSPATRILNENPNIETSI